MEINSRLNIEFDHLISFDKSIYHYIIILISIIIEIFLLDFSWNYLLYISISIVFIFLRNIILLYLQKNNTLIDDRKNWLFHLITRLMRTQGYSNEFVNYKILEHLKQLKNYDYRIELFPDTLSTFSTYSIPDISYGEEELIAMEQRIGKSLVVLVSAPIFFVVLHFVFNVKLSILILNTLLVFTFIEVITYDMRNPYKLDGWGHALNEIDYYQQAFNVDPYGTLVKFDEYFTNIYSYELALTPTISNNTPAYQSIGLLLLVINEIDPSISKQIIHEFLYATKDLPKVEDVHRKKWNAYSIQFVFINTAIILFSAILSSITIIIHYILEDIQVQSNIMMVKFINPSRYISEFAMILTLFISYSLSKPFLSQGKRKFMLVFWALEYFSIMYFISFFFRSIISGN